VVSAQSGQIVVIGGLMQNSTVKDKAGIPLLGQLPFIGSIFRHTRETSRKSELVILLRPAVVQGDEPWGEALSQSRQRIGRLENEIPARDNAANSRQ
jgi:MSHA biogenesis protein MshL